MCGFSRLIERRDQRYTLRADLLRRPDMKWMEFAQPYVFVREENRIKSPGQTFQLDWFPQAPIYKNPLLMSNLSFADQIMRLENKAFAATNMAMPRWVFYDCAVIPGFVAGFALPKDKAPQAILDICQPSAEDDFVPVSLFIIIPTMGEKEWVAHNLCSVNSLLPSEQRYYGLGFLSKAFGLWYANVEICSGITQWGSPSVRLHTHYGDFEVLTAYTPVHSNPQTLTYRLKSDPEEWERFFTGEAQLDFKDRYSYCGFNVDPKDVKSLISFQSRIEKGEGPFFLDAGEIRTSALDASLKVYRPT